MIVHHATVTVTAATLEDLAVALMQTGTELAVVGAPDRTYTTTTQDADITVNVTSATSDRHYVCAECGGFFEKNPDWTDNDANAEAVAAGFDLTDDLVTVCSACYRRLMAAADPSMQAWQRIIALFTGGPTDDDMV
jgi:hypothetical protein